MSHRTWPYRTCRTFAATVAVLLTLIATTFATAAERPNLVLIVADDLGYGDLPCYGCTDIKSPVIDKLAKQGVRFTDFYANGPECTPTRTALMTGRYQQRVGGLECAIGTGNVGRYDDAIRLCEAHELGLPTAQNVLMNSLRQAGYVIGGFGKWHLGYEPQFHPLRHGLSTYFGPIGGGVDYFYHCEWEGTYALYKDDKIIRREGYLTDLITDHAVGFLQRQRGDRPFCLYLPYTAPHTPIQDPAVKPSQPRTQENWNQGTREVYVAMVERLDKSIGLVLDELEQQNLADNTLVIFFSDNGGTKLARNAPLSGHKGTCFEGGIRVPCIVRWPGILTPGSISRQPCMTVDLTRSILQAVGTQAPESLPSDGIDILAHVAANKPDVSRTMFWRCRRGDRTWRAVRDGHLKYVSKQQGDQLQEHLFDLKADQGEKNDLGKAQPEQLTRLKSLLTAWEDDVRPSR